MAEIGFWRLAQQNPAWIAAIDPDGTEHTAAALAARVNQISHVLIRLGLKPGDGVATLLPNSAAVLEVYLAAIQSGR
jgi:long-chain acyl-CoA synthetase